MRRFVAVAVAAALFALNAGTVTANAEPASVRAALEAALPDATIDVVGESPVPGLYEVMIGEELFYVDRTGHYLFLGAIYDIHSHEDVTEARREELGYSPAPQATPNLTWESLPSVGAVIENKGAPHKLAIFADVNCPYCRQLAENLRHLPDIEIHTFLFPLWPESEAVTKAVLCADNPVNALMLAYEDRLVPDGATDCNPKAYGDIAAFARSHGINSTPQIVRSDGKRVMGLRSAAFLESWVRGADTGSLSGDVAGERQ